MQQNGFNQTTTDMVTQAILTKNKQLVSGSRPVPEHVRALLNQPAVQTRINKAFLGKNALPTGQERVLVSGEFNENNQF